MKTNGKMIINGNDITSIQTYDISFANPLSDIENRAQKEFEKRAIDHYNLNGQWSISGSISLNNRQRKQFNKWVKKLRKTDKKRLPRKVKKLLKSQMSTRNLKAKLGSYTKFVNSLFLKLCAINKVKTIAKK